MATRLGIGAVVFLVGLLVISRLVWQPFWIPSGSMKPTLMIGDYIAVNTWSRVVERGDVVVLKHPNSGAAFVDRLIGLPGDTVQMVNGVVHLNAQPIAQQRVDDFVEQMAPQGAFGNLPRCQNGQVALGADCIKEQAEETMPSGKSYFVLNIAEARGDNTPVYTVPAEHFFFLGDNRDNSVDSRYIQPNGLGMVPKENVVGRVSTVIFSSAGTSLLAFWTWRGDRFMVPVE